MGLIARSPTVFLGLSARSLSASVHYLRLLLTTATEVSTTGSYTTGATATTTPTAITQRLSLSRTTTYFHIESEGAAYFTVQSERPVTWLSDGVELLTPTRFITVVRGLCVITTVNTWNNDRSAAVLVQVRSVTNHRLSPRTDALSSEERKTDIITIIDCQ